MVALSFYLSVLVLLISIAATSLSFAYYVSFKHRSALWLALCMAGVSFFALVILVSGLAKLDNADTSFLGPNGLRLLWQALGTTLIIHSLPRFLLSAFGATPGRPARLSLDVATAMVVALSVIRVALGWNDSPSTAALPNNLLRVLVFTILGSALIISLFFQNRLPNRSLYKAIVVQIGMLTLLFPFVILEDLGSFRIPGFPSLSGQMLLFVTSISAIVHSQRSLMRPKYTENNKPSPFFVQRFGISDREFEVASGVLDGLGNNEIAKKLFISPRTVEKHLYNIYQKAGIKSRLQLLNLLRSD